jgi:ribonuclease HI
MKQILHTVHWRHVPGVISKSWVDDVNQRAEATKPIVQELLLAAAADFAQGVEDMGLVIADKSRVISSCPDLAEQIASDLRNLGFPIQAADVAPDLGIDRGHGAWKRKPTANARLASAMKRTTKVRKLTKAARRWAGGRHLFKTGVAPQAFYHTKIHGMPPSSITLTRRGAASVCAPKRSGRCLTALLALEYGKDDPAVAIPIGLFREWLNLMTDPAFHARAEAAWGTIRMDLEKNAKSRWRKIGGPTAAVIATLLDVGWTPCASNLWISPDAVEWELTPTNCTGLDVWDPTDLLDAIESSIYKNLWGSASKHYNGLGLEHGADVYGLRLHIKRLRKYGKHDLAGALICVATAAAWTRQRIVDLPSQAPAADLLLDDGMTSATCRRCGKAAETDFHRTWECEANDKLPACKKSKHLVSKAKAGHTSLPCLWLRGIIPATWTTDIIPQPPEVVEPTEECLGADRDQSGKIISSSSDRLLGCGDGSGGDRSADPRLRRAAWAWVTLNSHQAMSASDVTYSKMSVLPGRRQTVNRAELAALVDFAQSTEGPITYVTDSSYVMSGVARCRKITAGCKKVKHKFNADLWARFMPLLTSRDILVDKVESHLDIKDDTKWRDRYPASWVLGNSWADLFAGATAEDAALPFDVVGAIDWIDDVAACIRDRIAATLLDAAEKDPRGLTPPTPSPKKRAKGDAKRNKATLRDKNLAATKHSIAKVEGQRYVCSVCGSAPLAADLDAWLLADCVMPLSRPFAPDAAAPSGSAPIKIGRTSIHSSHTPSFSTMLGFWFCSTCGAKGKRYLQGLAAPCQPKKKSGVDNLARVTKRTSAVERAKATSKPTRLVLRRITKKSEPPPGYPGHQAKAAPAAVRRPPQRRVPVRVLATSAPAATTAAGSADEQWMRKAHAMQKQQQQLELQQQQLQQRYDEEGFEEVLEEEHEEDEQPAMVSNAENFQIFGDSDEDPAWHSAGDAEESPTAARHVDTPVGPTFLIGDVVSAGAAASSSHDSASSQAAATDMPTAATVNRTELLSEQLALHDLIDVASFGDRVEWPNGLNIMTAVDRLDAIAVALAAPTDTAIMMSEPPD